MSHIHEPDIHKPGLGRNKHLRYPLAYLLIGLLSCLPINSSHAQSKAEALNYQRADTSYRLSASGLRIPDPERYPELRSSYNGSLQRLLNQTVVQMNLAQAAKEQRFATVLVDLNAQNQPAVAAINPEIMLYAASLPKIAILYAVMQTLHVQNHPLDAYTKTQLEEMIQVSSNTAATNMLRLVGMQRLNDILVAPPYRFYDYYYSGGMWVGKEYARNNTLRQRDPLHNISHGASAMQTARFYYLMETGQLVSPAISRQMKAIMFPAKLEHKFVKGLNACCTGAKIYRKSGSWRQYHADSALVEWQGKRYIAVAILEDSHGNDLLVELIQRYQDIIQNFERKPSRRQAGRQH